MATVKAVLPQIYVLEFHQEPGDPDYGTCLWARFYFDTANYTMSIESDCGVFGYGWVPTPKSESFLHLMARCEGGYILDKIARASEIDEEETYNAVRQLYIDLLDDDSSEDEEVLSSIKEACRCDCVGDIIRALQEVEALENADDYSLYECIEHTHPAGAKKICEIFEKHIRPTIQATLREQTT